MAPLSSGQAAPPTVFVVDTNEGARLALTKLIASSGVPVEAFPGPVQFLDHLDPGRAGCVVANLMLTDMSGLELQRHLAERGSLLPLVFLSEYDNVPSAVAAMKAGAVDFILKPFGVQQLLDAIREAFSRNAALRGHHARRTAATTRLARLTARESEVLSHLVAGKTTKVIAAALRVSDSTVENHRAAIMRKTGVDHITGLVRLVIAAESEPPTVRRASE